MSRPARSEPPTAVRILRELRALADPVRASGAQRYFKTGPGEYGAGDRFLGIRVPVLRRLAAAHARLPLEELERLLHSPWHEARLLALLIMVRQYRRGTVAERNALHRGYLRNRGFVNNWDLVDLSAGCLVGAHVAGRSRALLKRLARSPDLWTRRIAVIATSHFIAQGDFGETMDMAATLLEDPQDLIHKAVGWMLREVGKRDRGTLRRFLDVHASKMPRTMLRYALERFPEAERRRFMAR